MIAYFLVDRHQVLVLGSNGSRTSLGRTIRTSTILRIAYFLVDHQGLALVRGWSTRKRWSTRKSTRSVVLSKDGRTRKIRDPLFFTTSCACLRAFFFSFFRGRRAPLV